jgi:hypothetical protein
MQAARAWGRVVTAAPNIDAAYLELQNEFDVESELLRVHLTEPLGRLALREVSQLGTISRRRYLGWCSL